MSRSLGVLAGILAGILTLGACHHEPKPATVATLPPPAAPPAAKPAPVPVSPNISAGDSLLRQCQLHFDNTQVAPKFDFDHSELTTQDRDVLQQIADCVTKGPLKGRGLALVGRADPRGTEEYNLGLGQRRASSVGTYLERLGVAKTAIKPSTRGALDASGADESGWMTDRRVDVDLD